LVNRSHLFDRLSDKGHRIQQSKGDERKYQRYHNNNKCPYTDIYFIGTEPGLFVAVGQPLEQYFLQFSSPVKGQLDILGKFDQTHSEAFGIGRHQSYQGFGKNNDKSHRILPTIKSIQRIFSFFPLFLFTLKFFFKLFNPLEIIGN